MKRNQKLAKTRLRQQKPIHMAFEAPYSPPTPVPQNILKLKTKNTHAAKIIHKFGTAARLVKALKFVGFSIDEDTVREWTHLHKERTAGVIPAHYWPPILKAARFEGILFTEEDFDPRPYLKLIRSPLLKGWSA